MLILNALDKKEMDTSEKLEIMINIRNFLNPDKYEENKKVLNKHAT